MKNYSVVLFDLDGTLTDPAIGITNSVMHALKKYDITVDDRRELYKFIGPPLHESFEKFYGFSREETLQAVEYYREYYRDKGIYENIVYDGVEMLLKNLYNSEKKIILATSKPEIFAREILRYFNLEKYFYYAAGANLDGSRTDKAEVIEYALKEGGVTDKSAAVMIGDREHDIIGANKNGLDSIGVLFGFGNREELENVGATYIAETVEELCKFKCF
ncbi:MAG: HAD family hydrolase [Acutalibacteraceae bacterium]|nr:HAD family hydrolase [Acutalibacteraceae bacterium]